MAKTKAGARKSGKSIERVVSYALSHRTRIYVLTILNEGTYTPDEIARIIDQPLNRVSHHIKELLERGSIELAEVRKVRNADQHYYRAVEMPFYTDEEMAAMTFEQRQVTYGLILQCMFAEALAALWSGNVSNDPRTWMAWRWFNVDERGRQDLADEQQRSWERYQEIEAESVDRRIDSGEDSASIVMGQMGFQRERTAPTPPPPAGAE